MPPRELTGSAGRLEALLEEPAAPGTIGHDGRVSKGHPGGLRAAVVADGARRGRFLEQRLVPACGSRQLTRRHDAALR